MSLELPSIQSVVANDVTINLPNLDNARITYLTAASLAAGTSLTVKDNSDFVNGDYLMVGTLGGQQTELVRINGAVTAGTALTTTALTFPHSNGALVTRLLYNQVQLYGSSSATDTNPTTIGSLVNLDVKKGNTVITASSTYAYYYAKYYNLQTTTYSSLSASAVATGLQPQSRGEIKKEFLSTYNNRIDDLISDDWLNRTINRWQRELLKRRGRWSCLRAQYLVDTVQDQQNYTLPTDISDSTTEESIVSVKYYNQPKMAYLDQQNFQQMTSDFIGSTVATAIGLSDITIVLADSSNFPASGSIQVEGDTIAYTGNTISTGTLTGVTGISATHAVGKEVWGTETTGDPSNYTVNNGKLGVFPTPGSAQAAKNIVIDYWKNFPALVNDTDLTLFPHPENCLYYLFWQESIRRRLPTDEQTHRQAAYLEDLESLVSDDGEFIDARLVPTQANYYQTYY